MSEQINMDDKMLEQEEKLKKLYKYFLVVGIASFALTGVVSLFVIYEKSK